jgi:hypothetical protein
MRLLKQGVQDLGVVALRRAIFADPGEGYWQLSHHYTLRYYDWVTPLLELDFAQWHPEQEVIRHSHFWFGLDGELIVSHRSLHGQSLSDAQWQEVLENPVPLLVRLALIS